MFRNSLLRYKIRRNNRKNSSLRNSIRFLDAKRIGIVFCSDTIEKHHAVKKLISELENMGKEVEVITYLGKGKDNHEFLYNYFTKKDFNMWGNYDNPHLKGFLNTKFDFLLCFDFQTNLFLRYILSTSPAKCRIGALEEISEDLFELMVKSNTKQIEDLVSTIRQYTFSLN